MTITFKTFTSIVGDSDLLAEPSVAQSDGPHPVVLVTSNGANGWIWAMQHRQRAGSGATPPPPPGLAVIAMNRATSVFGEANHIVCDQVMVYCPPIRRFVWAMLNKVDGADWFVRFAVIDPERIVANKAIEVEFWFDVTQATFGVTGTALFLDRPEIASSSHDLVFKVAVGRRDPVRDEVVELIGARIDWSWLATNRGSVNIEYFKAGRYNGIMPAHGCDDVVYFGADIKNYYFNQLGVWRWEAGKHRVNYYELDPARFSTIDPSELPGVGIDYMGRAGSNVVAATAASSRDVVFGLAAKGVNGRTKDGRQVGPKTVLPYILLSHVQDDAGRLRVGSVLTLWHDTGAWAYPALAHSAGRLGLAFVWSDANGEPSWGVADVDFPLKGVDAQLVASSTSHPPMRYGDYITIRPAQPNEQSPRAAFIATGYTVRATSPGQHGSVIQVSEVSLP